MKKLTFLVLFVFFANYANSATETTPSVCFEVDAYKDSDRVALEKLTDEFARRNNIKRFSSKYTFQYMKGDREYFIKPTIYNKSMNLKGSIALYTLDETKYLHIINGLNSYIQSDIAKVFSVNKCSDFTKHNLIGYSEMNTAIFK